MSFRITVQPRSRQFSCDESEIIFNALICDGVSLLYDCNNDACSSCKGKLVDGNITHRAHQEKALQVKEKELGFALFCCATPHSDITIEAREVAGVSEFPVHKMPTRVAKINTVADDVILLALQLPANKRLQYLAGQYEKFMLRDDKCRSYSMANAPIQGRLPDPAYPPHARRPFH